MSRLRGTGREGGRGGLADVAGRRAGRRQRQRQRHWQARGAAGFLEGKGAPSSPAQPSPAAQPGPAQPPTAGCCCCRPCGCDPSPSAQQTRCRRSGAAARHPARAPAHTAGPGREQGRRGSGGRCARGCRRRLGAWAGAVLGRLCPIVTTKHTWHTHPVHTSTSHTHTDATATHSHTFTHRHTHTHATLTCGSSTSTWSYSAAMRMSALVITISIRSTTDWKKGQCCGWRRGGGAGGEARGTARGAG